VVLNNISTGTVATEYWSMPAKTVHVQLVSQPVT
jgi:hypothetical protein